MIDDHCLLLSSPLMGTLELWYSAVAGTLEHWNTGTLVLCCGPNTGTLEHPNTGTLERLNSGTLLWPGCLAWLVVGGPGRA